MTPTAQRALWLSRICILIGTVIFVIALVLGMDVLVAALYTGSLLLAIGVERIASNA